jgi:hypothetical protein
MGKLLTAVALALCCTIHAFPQTQSGTPVKADNLYSTALFASIAEMDKSNADTDDGGGGRIRTNYRRMPVKKDPEITDDLPSEVGDFHVEYLDQQALTSRYKARHKEFSVLVIHPMRNEGPHLKIQVSLSWAMYWKGNVALAISDWSDVEFSYDCEKHTYVVSSVKLGGI